MKEMTFMKTKHKHFLYLLPKIKSDSGSEFEKNAESRRSRLRIRGHLW